MDNKKLIALVKKYSFLYDKRLANFKDFKMRHYAWEAIARQLHSSVDVCMKRWTSLRDRYSREARLASKSNWPLYSSMGFLKAHVKQRKKRGSKHVIDNLKPGNFTEIDELLESDSLNFTGSLSLPPSSESKPDYVFSPLEMFEKTTASKVSASSSNKNGAVEVEDKKLIELVKQYTFLYDKRLAAFKNVDKKRETWEEISRQLGISVKACRRRWTALRDRYTRENRLSLPNVSGDERESTWHWYSAMSFIKPFIRPRKSRHSTNFAEGDQFEIYEEDVLNYNDPLSWPQSDIKPRLAFSPTEFPEAPIYPEAIVSLSPAPCNEPQSIVDNPPLEVSDSRAFTGNDCASDYTMVKAFSEAVTCFKKFCENQMLTSNAAVESFGRMITATISEMSSRKQTQAIMQVTNLVMQIKEAPE